MNKMKKGELLLLTSGEYSDYSAHALGRVLEDFDPEALQAEWLRLHPDQATDYRANLGAFIAWIINDKALVEELNYREMNVGSYGILQVYLTGDPDEL